MSTAEAYWCESHPNVPKVWSSSSLATIGECRRKFELQYVEGWVGKQPNLDLLWGTAFHSCMEVYWRNRLVEVDHREALDRAVNKALRVGRDLPLPTRPKQIGKTTRGLVMSLVWYFDQWRDDPTTLVKFDGQPGLELHFNYALDLISPDGDPYIVQGYLDSIRIFNDNYTVWDYKTTGGSITDFYMDKFRIDIQNHIYLIAAHVLTGQSYTSFVADVVGVGLSYAVFERKPYDHTAEALDEALFDIKYFIKDAERCAELNYYPKNTKACAFCQFNGICDKSPLTRENFLLSDFEEKRRTTTGERTVQVA